MTSQVPYTGTVSMNLNITVYVHLHVCKINHICSVLYVAIIALRIVIREMTCNYYPNMKLTTSLNLHMSMYIH